MKKLVLSLVVVAGLTLGAQAQTEKGKFMIGGSVRSNSEKSSSDDKADFSFEVAPSVSYFISNNFAIGTGVGYTYDKNAYNYASSGISVAPQARYYVNLSDQFKFFGQLAVPMYFGNTKDVNSDNKVGEKEYTYNSYGVRLSPGFAFFPTKRFAIELSVDGLGYSKNTEKNVSNNDKYSYTNFGLNANSMAPRIGVNFHF